MRLLTNSVELEKEFQRLMQTYNYYYWTTAWASANTSPYETLTINESKIKQLVVGIHFYQTQPEFIEKFSKNDCVRYIMQPDGTFHPKVYLFCNNEKEWELIVGSGNFTHGAFSSNMEASILLAASDDPSNNIYKSIRTFVDNAWKEGMIIDGEELELYKRKWTVQRQKVQSLSGLYGNDSGEGKSKKKAKGKESGKPRESAIMNKSWDEFIKQVKEEKDHRVEKRLRVIKIANRLFSKVQHFHELKLEERKFIAGLPNKLPIEGAEDWGFFGAMRGAGIFKNRINENDLSISEALDQIPLVGHISKSHYDEFIKIYQKAFIGKANENATNLGTATRLLAMKRPDVFVCLDSKNKIELCRDFNISPSDMTYDRYWSDIILRVFDSYWWLNPKPKNEIEERVAAASAAFLDSLYYEHENVVNIQSQGSTALY